MSNDGFGWTENPLYVKIYKKACAYRKRDYILHYNVSRDITYNFLVHVILYTAQCPEKSFQLQEFWGMQEHTDNQPIVRDFCHRIK